MGEFGECGIGVARAPRESIVMGVKAFFAFLVMSLTGAAAAEPVSSAVREEKSRAMPVTVYPNFIVRGTALLEQFNGFARADDALVVSYVDAFKVAARIADAGVTRGQVWVYTAIDASLGQTQRENLRGAGAIVFVPDRRRTKDAPRRIAELLAEEARALGVPLVVGLERQDAGSLAAVADLARRGDVLLIDVTEWARGAGEKYRDKVNRFVRAAREENPKIRVELAFSATGTAAERKQAVACVTVNLDLADRVGVFCDGSAEARGTLAELIARLRPAGG